MPIPQDKVFLGMTRPATFLGTHYIAMMVVVALPMYAFVFTDSLWALALAVPLYVVSAAITAYDPHAFRLIALKIVSVAETIGGRPYWGGASRAPYGRRRF